MLNTITCLQSENSVNYNNYFDIFIQNVVLFCSVTLYVQKIVLHLLLYRLSTILVFLFKNQKRSLIFMHLIAFGINIPSNLILIILRLTFLISIIYAHLFHHQPTVTVYHSQSYLLFETLKTHLFQKSFSPQTPPHPTPPHPPDCLYGLWIAHRFYFFYSFSLSF